MTTEEGVFFRIGIHSSLKLHQPFAQRGWGLLSSDTHSQIAKERHGLTRMRLVDFQSLDGSTALLEPLLCWALGTCRNEGVHVLEIVGRWLEKGGFIEAVAPHRRRLEPWRFVYRANNPSLATTLRDPRAWAPSLCDGDAAL